MQGILFLTYGGILCLWGWKRASNIPKIGRAYWYYSTIILGMLLTVMLISIMLQFLEHNVTNPRVYGIAPAGLKNLKIKAKTGWILVVVVKRHHENGLVTQNGTSVMLQSECCALQKKALKSLWNSNLQKLSTYTAEVTIHSSLIFQQEYNCTMYRFF